MRKYFLALVVILFNLSQARGQAHGGDEQIVQGISTAASDFHNRLSQLQNKTGGITASDDLYAQKDFNSLLAHIKLELLQHLPDEAVPLRRYIEQHFPSAVETVSPSGGISAATANHTVAATDSFLQNLKNASPYRLDLIVDSSPRDALFQLKSAGGDTLTRGTLGTFTNVWRGEYSYTVIKAGQKTIVGTIDLIREKGNTLSCHFVPIEEAGPALPCNFSQSSVNP